MKLSDKKNYKIKGNNNSRKKRILRKKATTHYKSKRRHQKKQDMKRKTMKIYVGGVSPRVNQIKDPKAVSIPDSVPDVPVKSDSVPDVPVKSDSVPDVPVKSDSVPDVPVKSDSVPDVPVKSDSVPDVPVKSDSVPDVPVKSDSVPDVPVKADSVPDVPVKADRPALAAAAALDSYDATSPNCDTSNFNSDVPDDEAEAEEKYNKIADSLEKCPEEEQLELVVVWVDYVDNFKAKFNKDPKQFVIDKDCDKLFEGYMNFNNVPDDKMEAKEKLSKYIELISTDDKCSDSVLNAISIYTDKMYEIYPELKDEIPEPDTPPVPEDDAVIPFTELELEQLYNQYKSSNRKFKQIGFIKLLTAKTSIGNKIRKLFDIPNDATNASAYTTGRPLNKMFANIINTIGKNDKDDDSSPVKDIDDISFIEFKSFIECGTYRDKSDKDFNCVNVKKPDTPTDDVPSDSGSTAPPTDDVPSDSGSTAPPTDDVPTDDVLTDDVPNVSGVTPPSENIELQINEKGFDGALKRVDISIFVPHDSKVLVRDYAKQTAKQTINGLSNIGN